MSVTLSYIMMFFYFVFKKEMLHQKAAAHLTRCYESHSVKYSD